MRVYQFRHIRPRATIPHGGRAATPGDGGSAIRRRAAELACAATSPSSARAPPAGGHDRREPSTTTSLASGQQGRARAFVGPVAPGPPAGALVGSSRVAQLSSRGLGRRPLTAETGVRIPVAVPRKPAPRAGFVVLGRGVRVSPFGWPCGEAHVAGRCLVVHSDDDELRRFTPTLRDRRARPGGRRGHRGRRPRACGECRAQDQRHRRHLPTELGSLAPGGEANPLGSFAQRASATPIRIPVAVPRSP